MTIQVGPPIGDRGTYGETSMRGGKCKGSTDHDLRRVDPPCEGGQNNLGGAGRFCPNDLSVVRRLTGATAEGNAYGGGHGTEVHATMWLKMETHQQMEVRGLQCKSRIIEGRVAKRSTGRKAQAMIESKRAPIKVIRWVGTRTDFASSVAKSVEEIVKGQDGQ